MVVAVFFETIRLCSLFQLRVLGENMRATLFASIGMLLAIPLIEYGSSQWSLSIKGIMAIYIMALISIDIGLSSLWIPQVMKFKPLYTAALPAPPQEENRQPVRNVFNNLRDRFFQPEPPQQLAGPALGELTAIGP